MGTGRIARRAAAFAALAVILLGSTVPSGRAVQAFQQPGDRAPSYITVAATPSPSLAGDDVTFTASVRTADGSPITVGRMGISGGGPGGPFRLVGQPVDANGEVMWTMPAELCCSFALAYSDPLTRFDSSSYGTFGERPDRFPSSLVVTSGGPSPLGGLVTFVATAGAAGTVDGGAMTFSATDPATGGEVFHATATVDAMGLATASHRFDAAGNYEVIATYSGTERVEPRVARMTQSVGCAAPLTPTALALRAAQPVSLVGAPVTFTAAVSANGAPVSVGSVEISVGDVRAVLPVGADGTATWSVPGDVFATTGTRPVSASYLPGSHGYLPSSATVDHRVIPDQGFLPGTTSVIISPNPVVQFAPTVATVIVTTLDGQPYPISGITLFRFFPFTDSDVFVPIVDGRGTVTMRFQYPGTVQVRTSRIPESVGINVVVLPATAATTADATPPDQLPAAPPVPPEQGSNDTEPPLPALTVPDTTVEPERPSSTTTAVGTIQPPPTTQAVETTEPATTTDTPTTAPAASTAVDPDHATDLGVPTSGSPSGFRLVAQVPVCPPAAPPVAPAAPAAPPAPAAPAPFVNLPTTGSQLAVILSLTATLLVLSGGGLLLASRRERRSRAVGSASHHEHPQRVGKEALTPMPRADG